jgi:hypothetical protein
MLGDDDEEEMEKLGAICRFMRRGGRATTAE